jgi:hypothetical protein
VQDAPLFFASTQTHLNTHHTLSFKLWVLAPRVKHTGRLNKLLVLTQTPAPTTICCLRRDSTMTTQLCNPAALHSTVAAAAAHTNYANCGEVRASTSAVILRRFTCAGCDRRLLLCCKYERLPPLYLSNKRGGAHRRQLRP